MLINKKICLFTSSLGWGGLERNLLVMAGWMAEAGHEAIVGAVAGSPTSAQAHTMPRVRVVDIGTHSKLQTLRASSQWRPWVEEADLLWIRDPKDLAVASHVSKATGTPLLVQQAMQLGAPKTMPWHKARFQAVDAWVSGLEWLRNQALSWTPLTESQCHVMPLPLDDRWFDEPNTDADEIRQGLGLDLPEGARLVATFGRLDEGKGQRVLIRAMKGLPTNVHALFIGDNTVTNEGDELVHLERMAQELGVSERVHFLPSRGDLIPCYDAIDVFVMSSRSETIGTVTLEAMARRVPVVGANSGGTAELISGNRGEGFEPDNAEDLQRAIGCAFAWDEQRREQTLDAAWQLAHQSQQSVLLPRWLALVDDVIRLGGKS